MSKIMPEGVKVEWVDPEIPRCVHHYRETRGADTYCDEISCGDCALDSQKAFAQWQAEQEEKTECKVESPTHYKLIGDFETIDVIKELLTKEEFIGYLKGNILKYCTRADKKNGLEDRKKAHKYNEWLIEELRDE